jgi:hypothetical protein
LTTWKHECDEELGENKESSQDEGLTDEVDELSCWREEGNDAEQVEERGARFIIVQQ